VLATPPALVLKEA